MRTTSSRPPAQHMMAPHDARFILARLGELLRDAEPALLADGVAPAEAAALADAARSLRQALREAREHRAALQSAA